LTQIIGAIDIGTNSTKMTVGSIDEGRVSVVFEDSEVTRLGAGVDANKTLQDDAVKRTIDAVVRFAEAARSRGAERVVAAGTSALRDASNGPAFIDEVKRKADVDVEIISGNREAELAYSAIASDPDIPHGGSILVYDIGGGSTELIVGGEGGVERFKSLDIGAVRLTERHVNSDPPTSAEIDAIRTNAREALKSFDFASDSRVAGIGGTAINIAAVANPHLGKKVHGVVVSRDELATAIGRFASCSLEDRRKIKGLEPERADVITAGALILDELLEAAGADRFVVSVRGMRFGLIAAEAGKLR